MPAELRRTSTGDEDASSTWRQAGPGIYEDFAEPLFDYCAGLLGDQAAAASAVQDSLVDVDTRLSELPEPAQLRVWLYGAARRKCLARRPGRRPSSAGPPGTTAAGQLDTVTPGIQAPGGQDETLLVATAALASLADRDQEVLNLSFRHGLQPAELAAVLGLSARRARSLLSRASARFRRSAAMVVVLRAGWLGCNVLARIAGQQDPAPPPPLASKLSRRLDCHIDSCPACARTLGNRAWDPGLISQVPLVLPVGQLRLRIIRTALARGSYRRQAGLASGGIPAPTARPRRAPRVMVASSAALAVLAALGVLLYRHESAPAASPRPIPAKAAPGNQDPAAASVPRFRELPALPALGASPLGVLPARPLGQAGPSPSPDPRLGWMSLRPGPSHAPWPSPKPANPSPTPVPAPIPDPAPPSPVT